MLLREVARLYTRAQRIVADCSQTSNTQCHLLTELGRFPNAELVWCQEEPKNMGGWTFVDPWLELTLDKLDIKAKRARYVGRPASASTAAGLMSRHLKELDAFLTDAFA